MCDLGLQILHGCEVHGVTVIDDSPVNVNDVWCPVNCMFIVDECKKLGMQASDFLKQSTANPWDAHLVQSNPEERVQK